MFGNGFWQTCSGLSGFGRFNYGGIIMMIIGAALFLVILFLILKKSGTTFSEKGEETPLETLQRRFVNGEIDKDEFLEKKQILESR